MKDPFFDQCFWGGPVGDSFVQRISTHMLLELGPGQVRMSAQSEKANLDMTALPLSVVL